MVILPNGDVVVAGKSYFTETGGDKQSTGFGDLDGWIVALDAAGRRKWDATLGGTSFDEFGGLAFNGAESLICVGSSSSEAGPGKSAPIINGLDLWVAAFALDGTRLWDYAFDRGAWDVGRCVCGDSADGWFIGGETGPSSDEVRGWVLHLDSRGHRIWDKHLGNTVPFIQGIDFRQPDRLFVGGSVLATNTDLFHTRFWLSKLNPADGSVEWELPLGTSFRGKCMAVHATRDGGVLGAGYSAALHPQGHMLLTGLVVKAGGSGELLWQREFRFSARNTTFSGVLETGDNGVIAIGHENYEGPRVWILRFGPEGQVMWRQSVIPGTWSWSHRMSPNWDGGWVVLTSAFGGSPDKVTPPWGSSSDDIWLVKFAPEKTTAQREPPQLSVSPFLGSYLGSDGFHFSLIGTSGRQYVTERSIDLTTWAPFATNTVLSSDVKLVDPFAATNSHITYRTRATSP